MATHKLFAMYRPKYYFPQIDQSRGLSIGFGKLSTKQNRWCIFARSGPILWWYLINAALHYDQLSAAGTGSIK